MIRVLSNVPSVPVLLLLPPRGSGTEKDVSGVYISLKTENLRSRVKVLGQRFELNHMESSIENSALFNSLRCLIRRAESVENQNI